MVFRVGEVPYGGALEGRPRRRDGRGALRMAARGPETAAPPFDSLPTTCDLFRTSFPHVRGYAEKEARAGGYALRRRFVQRGCFRPTCRQRRLLSAPPLRRPAVEPLGSAVLAVGKPRPPLFAPWPCETARSDGALPPADDRHEKGGSLLVYKDKPSGRCFVVWERPWFFRHWEPPPKGVVSYQGSPLV